MGFLDTITAAYDSVAKVLANKIIDLGANTVTGTLAQFNVALTDADFAALVGTEAAATASVLAKRDANGNLLAASFLPNAPVTTTSGGTTTILAGSGGVQIFTGTLGHTAKLDSVNVGAGQPVVIVNRSNGNISITASDGTNITTIVTQQMALVWAVQATPTTTTHWAFFRTLPLATTATGTTLAQRDGFAILSAANFIPNFNTSVTAGGTVTLTVGSAKVQERTGSANETEVLPSATVAAGQGWEFWNRSTGTLTINASDGTLVKSLGPGGFSVIRARQATPTTTTHWVAS